MLCVVRCLMINIHIVESAKGVCNYCSKENVVGKIHNMLDIKMVEKILKLLSS